MMMPSTTLAVVEWRKLGFICFFSDLKFTVASEVVFFVVFHFALQQSEDAL